MPNALAIAAYELARRGWYIHPSKPNSKEPFLVGWREKSTNHLTTIQKWFSSGIHNPLIDCGKSGLLVVDLDMKNGIDGRWSYLYWLAAHNMAHPNTFLVQTPSGGMHCYYRAPADSKLGNSSGSLPENIDIRGVGGYVVGPGSVIDGKTYTIPRGWNRPLEAAPRGLIDALTPRALGGPQRPFRADMPVDAAGVYRFAIRQIEKAPEGRRNRELNSMAYWLGRFVGGSRLDRADTEEILIQAGMNAGLTERECIATVNSGLNAGELRPLGLIPIPNPSTEIA